MNINSILFLFIGSACGLTFRFFIQNNFKFKAGFYINNISIINFFASFLLGIFVACRPFNRNLSLLFYSGFLGCFSTFASFIYQLFILLQRRKFVLLILHYLEVFLLSFLFFYGGYFIIQFLINE